DAPDGSGTACLIDNPVTLDAVLALDGNRRIAVSGTPLLACAYASQLGTFLRTIADPMALGHFGASIREVRTGPGFQCRYRNRASGGKVSAHGRGIALDIAGFELTDGRVVAVGTGPMEDRAFIDAIRKASCGHFTTVLGPGSDSAHETHVHFDTERHGRSDAYRICQ
ncbi:MAG: extensin family protein, partial [Flavobacteriaceae bacterium]